ncbi:MAG TPA: metal ABC transporter permease [Candidatus Limnocylindrales bacterium]|jgi:ABC-type Mn2+/Zn2+ transport system permease subunit|nr:metal ABC transporter permease [Candidatus Limnocylindrales bacterium]
MSAGELYALLLALLIGVAAGLVGSFALMKRMLLASDVISHLALPGLGIAFLLKINPLVGGGAALFLGTLLIWRLQTKSGLAVEAAIGVVFATAVAIGASITPREDILEALFGSFQRISLTSFFVGAVAVAGVIVALFLLKDRLVLSIFSPELAATSGVKVRLLDLYFLLLFSLVVLVGLRYMGALLASALLILPAATGRQLASNIAGFLAASASASVTAVLLGYLASSTVWKMSTPAPAIVMFGAAMFVISLAFSNRKLTLT